MYLLTVRGQDMNGLPGGRTATATATVYITDVNDHTPKLEKEEVVLLIMHLFH